MTAYDIMLRANRFLIMIGSLTPAQAKTVTCRLLAAKTPREAAQRFHAAVNFSGNTDAHGRRMYPEYYIPPYNGGKKLKTLTGVTPKTHILAANSYELEIMRLLHILNPCDDEIAEMNAKIACRLKSTCFGFCDDGVGECFDASLVTLRYLSAVFPRETSWIIGRINNFNQHYHEKRRHSGVLMYYILCLSEAPHALAVPEIARHASYISAQLGKSFAVNNPRDSFMQPMMMCAARNALARLPEFSYIKDIMPYVGTQDNRLHFDMDGRQYNGY